MYLESTKHVEVHNETIKPDASHIPQMEGRFVHYSHK